MEDYLQTCGKDFSLICYVGDGRNDFCPSLRLSDRDLTCVRWYRYIIKYNLTYVSGKITAWRNILLRWRQRDTLSRLRNFCGQMQTPYIRDWEKRLGNETVFSIIFWSFAKAFELHNYNNNINIFLYLILEHPCNLETLNIIFRYDPKHSPIPHYLSITAHNQPGHEPPRLQES